MEKLYWVWDNMKDRCNNPNHKEYKNYGGRGIAICEEWKSYANFKSWAMSSDYRPDAKRGECTIDRINCNGNYEPDNCRWISMKEQNRNQLREKPIYQCDLNGNIIERFDGFIHASEALNIDRGGIRKCCIEERKTAGGFTFRFAEEEKSNETV